MHHNFLIFTASSQGQVGWTKRFRPRLPHKVVLLVGFFFNDVDKACVSENNLLILLETMSLSYPHCSPPNCVKPS